MFTRLRRRNERTDADQVERGDADGQVSAYAGGRARGVTRGVATLLGAAGAGLLIWLATQVNDETTGGYWAVYGLLAAAGLTLAFSQLLGGWTKWGWPRLSASVLLLGFLPALFVGGWLLLAHQPDANWFRTHSLDWANDAGAGGFVEDLRAYIPVIAFGLGLLFGFTFDTTGPRVREPALDRPRRRDVEEVGPREDRAAADEPVAAERQAAVDEETDEAERPHGRRDWFGRRKRARQDGDAAVAERPRANRTED